MTTNGSQAKQLTNGRAQPVPYVGDPWERQPGESEKAFKAFTLYRDMGSHRTLVDAERQYRALTGGTGPATRDPSGQFGAWSSAHRWRERVQMWDDEQDAIAVRAMKRERIKMAERHAQHLEAAQHAMFAPVEEVVRRMASGQMDLSDISNRDLLVLFRQVVGPLAEFQKAERLARGAKDDDSPDVFLFGAIAQRSIGSHLEGLEVRLAQMNALPDAIEGEVVDDGEQ